MSSLLPVALVTGFLGAGKTTFMRHLLGDAKARGLKVGVVINEFGVADIDGEILRQSGAEMLGTLAGGCACCSSQDEMIWTMLELGRQTRENRPDAVLLEASGLADPLVMLDGLTVAALLPLIRVASVVSVVDALRLPELKDEDGRLAPLLQRQIALADLVIANKSDLAFRGESTKNEGKFAAESLLRNINSSARLEFARGGAVNLDEFWARVLNSESAAQAPHASQAIHGHAQTLIVPMKKPIAREKLENALRNLGEDVWRVKGFVRLQGENDLFLVQWSGSGAHFAIERFELHNLNALPPAELVFIGPSLDQITLWRDFHGAAPLL
ncbi:GTPase, G3E family [Abditibacterium utsteinense]|uniref:GTPase, G3E family n=1 Tax=Abditibacterium utsteinense TaxID=1960156 RepID=A0A2S8SUY0_9BACT|nr:GTP-binding protein [Abditibacterium utsteinense]PQV64605.1 GTPase, G3E family [Abditibacterium utsteinense]